MQLACLPYPNNRDPILGSCGHWHSTSRLKGRFQSLRKTVSVNACSTGFVAWLGGSYSNDKPIGEKGFKRHTHFRQRIDKDVRRLCRMTARALTTVGTLANVKVITTLWPQVGDALCHIGFSGVVVLAFDQSAKFIDG